MNDLESKIKELGQKYSNISVQSVEEGAESLTMHLAVKGGPTAPASLPSNVRVVSSTSADDAFGVVDNIRKESAARKMITLDPMTREDLDLAEMSVLQSSPQDLYQRSIEYSRCKDIYGSAINTLANFAFTGFENDIDDPTIKNFFDHWTDGVGFDDIVEKIFYDFFRVGLVCTYKILGKYEPKISYISPVPGQKAPKVKEQALKKNRFSNSFIPIAYTVLNPTMVEVRGSLMFGQSAIFLSAKAGEEIKEMLEIPTSQLSDFQKKILTSLPAPFKKAAKDGKEIPLDPNLVGQICYRKMPYERYPMPRSARAFEALEFKNELRKADYSTLDGITNYILKITVGNDAHPVTKQETLDRVSELFDTVSKSFKVVWGHTLDIEKITSPEIGQILGPEKYTQVNSDITAGLNVTRALIDGVGTGSDPAIKLAVKSVIEEINYARRQVQRWIYSEYRTIADAMGFDRIPRVRFNDMALRDELQMMTLIQGMIDRRIISYRTGQKKLGFDPDTELAQMERERPLVEDGILGIVGSPFQQSSNRQSVQGTPQGTPSEGRPVGKKGPTPKPKDQTVPDEVPAPKVNEAANIEIEEVIDRLSLEEIETLLLKVKASKHTSKKASTKKKKSPPE